MTEFGHCSVEGPFAQMKEVAFIYVCSPGQQSPGRSWAREEETARCLWAGHLHQALQPLAVLPSSAVWKVSHCGWELLSVWRRQGGGGMVHCGVGKTQALLMEAEGVGEQLSAPGPS